MRSQLPTANSKIPINKYGQSKCQRLQGKFKIASNVDEKKDLKQF